MNDMFIFRFVNVNIDDHLTPYKRGLGDTMKQDMTTERYRAPALDKGLDIIELLAGQPKGLTRTSIVKAMARSPSEIYRMLERLVARGYVTRSAEGDRYELSMKLFILASRQPALRRLVGQAQPLMDLFAHASHQSCHLVIPDEGMGLIIAQASPPDIWEFRVRVGAQLDPLTTASGKVLLAFQNHFLREKTLTLLREQDRLIGLEEIEPELASIRERGYRIGESQQLIGARDVTAPILDPYGDAIAVMTCAYIIHLDMEGDSIEVARDRLLDMANTLSVR